MRKYIKIVLINLTFFACVNEKESKLPNVIVILADDMGWGDIGYNNLDHVYTPNLNKLAQEGVTFTQHYTMPQCTPTRVAVFTGRYPGRFSNNALEATNNKVLPRGIPTLATMFKQEGYSTFICGKWHMGSDTINGPNHYGFDESYGSKLGTCHSFWDTLYRPEIKYIIT